MTINVQKDIVREHVKGDLLRKGSCSKHISA